MQKKKKKSKVGILGYGEVGQAIAKIYETAGIKPFIKDLNRSDGLENCDILNICIPYRDESFIEITKKEISTSNAKLTIIHSTVAPGTTKKIGGNAVHSPVRGIHPHLHEGIMTFVKYIGAETEEIGNKAKEHLESLGIKTKIVMPAITSELAKLLDTTYYGLCIAWHGEMRKICDKEGVDFKKIADYNKDYNEGYAKLGKANVIRPVLYPPEKEIGGHCVIQNAEILNKFYKSKAVDLVLDYKPLGKND